MLNSGHRRQLFCNVPQNVKIKKRLTAGQGDTPGHIPHVKEPVNLRNSLIDQAQVCLIFVTALIAVLAPHVA